MAVGTDSVIKLVRGAVGANGVQPGALDRNKQQWQSECAMTGCAHCTLTVDTLLLLLAPVGPRHAVGTRHQPRDAANRVSGARGHVH